MLKKRSGSHRKPRRSVKPRQFNMRSKDSRYISAVTTEKQAIKNSTRNDIENDHLKEGNAYFHDGLGAPQTTEMMRTSLLLAIAGLLIALAPASAQESDKEPAAVTPNASSVSPDKKWEYKCVEYNGVCWSQIVKAGTTQVVVDLTYAPDGAGATNPEILWAPDSKRFAFNYSPVQRHHTGFHRALNTVAFYQLRGDKWEALRSLEDETTQTLAKGHVPKNAYPRHCDPEVDTFKLRNWTDANTAILYAACYQRNSGDLGSRFLFTLKFDEAGNWKIVKAHQMSKKEFEEEQ
jgi:hypothetical protein